MAVIEPIRRSRLYQDIVSQIETLLDKGELRPGDQLPPERALGWATGFRAGSMPSGYRVHFTRQRTRTMEILLLALLWGAALWVTRRPVRHA